MNLLQKMDAFRDQASWAVWRTDGAGALTGDVEFPLDAATEAANDRAMIVALNPGGISTPGASPTPDWSNFHNPNPKHNDIFLAHAFIDTPYWGAYMTDLHPDLVESNSGLVRPRREAVRSAVASLIDQGRILGSVETIVCLGAKCHSAVLGRRREIEAALGAVVIARVPHYSRSNAGVHKHDAQRYRKLVLQAIDSSDRHG